MPFQRNPVRSIYKIPACRKDGEYFQTLLRKPGMAIERIISFGQRTPPGVWLSQAQDEWVMLLSGSATLTFWKDNKRLLKPGDYLYIPAGLRHRVERTHPKKPSVWLALHVGVSKKAAHV